MAPPTISYLCPTREHSNRYAALQHRNEKSQAPNRLALDVAGDIQKKESHMNYDNFMINNMFAHCARLPRRTTPEPMFSLLAFDAGKFSPETYPSLS